MPYYDLNVPWAQSAADLHKSLTFMRERMRPAFSVRYEYN